MYKSWHTCQPLDNFMAHLESYGGRKRHSKAGVNNEEAGSATVGLQNCSWSRWVHKTQAVAMLIATYNQVRH